jgi:hypothetical protein
MADRGKINHRECIEHKENRKAKIKLGVLGDKQRKDKWQTKHFSYDKRRRLLASSRSSGDNQRQVLPHISLLLWERKPF